MSSANIFNRTPTIAEDTLQYNIYSTLREKSDLAALATCIQSFVDSLLPGFLWHRDPFEVKVIKDEASSDWILQGRMRVGDCVDDEWCAVWLLKQISEKWEEIVISVFDSDGEFLLIEAADALPAWVQPSNSENRVWIHSAHLHLVPLGHVSPPSRKRHRRKLPGTIEDEDDDTNLNTGDDDDFIAAEDAVLLVRDPLMDTKAPKSVEKIVWQRISGYPEVARQHVHHAKAWLPEDIAKALANNPSLVQKAVEAFYTRDAIQLRAANKMSRFPPSPSVLQTVKMTRTAYAQLIGQKFFPPKIFGRWTEKEDTKDWRWKDVGMKIACGFEMLYQESKNKNSTSGNSAEQLEAAKESLQRDGEYKKYIESLKSVGYFKEELPGSHLWKSLEDNAVKKFVETRRADNASRLSFAQLANSAAAGTTAAFAVPTQDEDSDDWLTMDQESFDSMLQQAAESKRPTAATGVDNGEESEEDPEEKRHVDEQAARLKDLADKVEKFVDNEGDLEGARFEDDILSDEEFSDGMGEDDDESEKDEATRQSDMDKLVEPIKASEYGSMPASYSKSQKVTTEQPVVESTEDEPMPKANSNPFRKPFLPRDNFDGVVSDEETDSDEEADEEDDDAPQVVGEIEVDMDEEEAEFLEFSRQALGISDDQWHDIVRDRMGRGAFVPAGTTVPEKKKEKPTQAAQPATDSVPKTEPRKPAPGPRPNVNPNLDSFEAVMEAMEIELSKSRGGQKSKSATVKPTNATIPKTSGINMDGKGKGKGKATVEDIEEEDVEMEMDAELRAALNAPDDDEDEDSEREEGDIDYNLIKNFLESFKSQGGLSGPVSNLAGRLQPGWQLPRDNA